jgi:hypothetical protein
MTCYPHGSTAREILLKFQVAEKREGNFRMKLIEILYFYRLVEIK